MGDNTINISKTEALITAGLITAGTAASYLAQTDKLKDEIERVCGKGIPPDIMREIINAARPLGGSFDRIVIGEPSREERLRALCEGFREKHRAPLRVVVSKGLSVENGASRPIEKPKSIKEPAQPLPPAAKEIQWGAALKTAGYGLLTLGAAVVTTAAGIATIGTALDPIPGDEVALGAATTAMAGITATAATTFYFSAQTFLRSLFD